MSKKKSKKEVEVKPLMFIGATMKDGLLDYSYEIKSGIGSGNIVSVKGKGLFEDDLSDAFANLNVHMAAIADIFKHAGVDVEAINKVRNNELTALFSVAGFKIKGSDEDMSVILVGHYRISCTGDWMDITTPKIPVDKLSSYEWAKELREAIEQCKEEAELYHGGKHTAPEKDEVNPNQMTIAQELEEAGFETGRV